MSESVPRSYLRDSRGPRVVDASHGREQARGDGRRKHNGSEGAKQRVKHNLSWRYPRPEPSSHYKRPLTLTGNHHSSACAEHSTLEMNFLQQPQEVIALGVTVETSVMVSLKLPSAGFVDSYLNLDTSRLIGVVTLVAEGWDGETTPVENGRLGGQKCFDSIHPIPEHVEEALARSQPSRLALGYFSFSDLLVRQNGSYRLRITLMKVGASNTATELHIDSEPIKVETRTTASSDKRRRHQRA